MLETTLVALQDITLEKIFDDSGKKIKRVYEFMDSERLMKEVKPRAERYGELQDSTS